MQRVLNAPLAINWRRLGITALATVNFILLAVTLAAFVFADVGLDWRIWAESGQRVFGGQLYEWADHYRGDYRYSPVLAYGFAIIAPIGYAGWTALHFVALLALPRRLALLTLISFPFWADVYNGGVMTFVFVAAALALAGSRVGAYAFLALTLLIPRPLMLPVAAWLMWKRPEWRWPFIGLVILHGVAVLASGWAFEWTAHLLELSQSPAASEHDLGPARLIGSAWVPIGLSLAAWLTWRGRLGLASLAASPYWLGYYTLMLLLEVQESRPPRRTFPHG